MIDFLKTKYIFETMDVLTMITAIVVALITALFGPAFITWIKLKFENKKISTNKILDETIEYNRLIDDQLEDIMDELECDRIWVGQFHNGGHYFPTGKCIQKFSIFFEKDELEVISLRNIFLNIPVSFFPKSLSKIYNEGELTINSFEKDETYDLDIFSKLYGSKSFYIWSIEDLGGRFVGILAIEYIEKEYEITKEEKIYIKYKTGAIGALLHELLKKKSPSPYV